jgi:hypothetical protein
MKQQTVTCFESDNGKVKIFVDNDLAIGYFHDFLMQIKGTMVDRMVEAHKQQVEQSEVMKQMDGECCPPPNCS